MSDDKVEKQASEQLADIAKELVRQNRSRTRWRVILVLIIFGYFGVMSYFAAQESKFLTTTLQKQQPFIAEVALRGMIFTGGEAEAGQVIHLLESAFSAEQSVAVMLRLNSPGGSPVQSHQIYNAIVRLKEKHNKKLYAVVDDMCLSGCYFVAAAADEIYADSMSIIGSIGVIIASFGAVEALEKLGMTRRLYTAGENKALLDMFSPEDIEAVDHIQTEVLAKTHQYFIDAVKKGRGTRLQSDDNLFTGLVWLGDASKEFGLIDDIGDADYVANEIIGIDTRIVFEKEKTLFEQLKDVGVKGIARGLAQLFSPQSITMH